MYYTGDGDQLRSSVFRFKDDVVYEYLLLPHLPFVPDYLEVMSSLCDMLSSLYENIIHKDTYGWVKEVYILFYCQLAIVLHYCNCHYSDFRTHR